MSNDSLNEHAGGDEVSAHDADCADDTAGNAVVGALSDDPRMQRGAYVTDGTDLYEVTNIRRAPGVMGFATVRVTVENCHSFRTVEFLPDRIRHNFSLVKQAPLGKCPDLVQDIVW